MPVLHRDFETRSTLNLSDVGASRYATHPETDVWCCAYCVDDGPVKLWVPGFCAAGMARGRARSGLACLGTMTISSGRLRRTSWRRATAGRSFLSSATDAQWPPRWPWRCPQADKVAAALGLAQQKDNAGKLNMMALSRPRKPRKGEPAGVYWHDDPARLERLYAYCKQDIATERALHVRIGFLPPAEQAVWQLDAAITDRGIFIDGELAAGAIKIDEAAHVAIDAELSTITAGSVTSISQTAKLSTWLAAHG